MLRTEIMYVVNDTTCQIEFETDRVSFQHTDGRRGMLKFPNKNGKVVSSDTRQPGVGKDRIQSVFFGEVALMIIREADDE